MENEAFENNSSNSPVQLKSVKSYKDSAIDITSGDGTSSSSRTEITSNGFDNYKNSRIVVLGSGDFGRAIADKLVKSGYSVTIASRDPDKNNKIKKMIESFGASLMTIDEAFEIKDVEIVIFAIHKNNYEKIPYSKICGNVIIDVSNRNSTKKKMTISQAEYLQNLSKSYNISVVKALNVLSAYSLQNNATQGSKIVPISGDNYFAKEKVSEMIRNMGYQPDDLGGLRHARDIEDIPLQQFTSWKAPFIISLIIFIFLYVLSFSKFQVCWTLTWGTGEWHWDFWHYIPMDNVNKTLAIHALTMLTTCYLPGVIAAYIQLIRNTKYSRFPKWLDRWLKMRKQLGLLMLFSASIHACLSMATFSPAYNEVGYVGATKEINATTLAKSWSTGEYQIEKEGSILKVVLAKKMDWRGECFLMAGVVCYFLSVILGLTSLPSVGAGMSWKEFTFVQSKLGWMAMIFGCAHDLFYGWPYINSPSCYIPSGFQYALYLPGLTLVLKIPILLLNNRLERIRAGG